MAKIHTGADVKSQFKQLSEADLRAYSDEASFQKGYDYYLHHAIVEPTLSESVLRAFCHGSGLSPYRVVATLLPAGDKSAHKVVSAGCSCPRGGFCKHLVALLLTWIHQPERFVVRSRLMGRLDEKSREELLALLEQLVQRQPDIEPMVELLIELPLAAPAQEKNRPGRGKERTVDPSSISSQVDSAFYNAGEGWGAASRVASDLEQLCDIGKSFAEAGEWANAQVVYATIAEETVIRYEVLHDEGEVSWIMGQCAAGLVACLNVQSTLPKREQLEVEDREELLTSLFDLWKFGDNYGGIGVDIPMVIAEKATAEERKRVEGWLREEMRPEQDSSSTWRNRGVVDFVVKLKQAEHSSDEDVLEECIYLDEGEVGQALAALAELERAPRTSLYGYGYRPEPASSSYQAQVAQAAEESYPDEAIRLYKSVVQRLIDGRGRENYQQATGYLIRVRRLYQKQGRESEWDAYITNLRNSNKSLRALKEELDKKGL